LARQERYTMGLIWAQPTRQAQPDQLSAFAELLGVDALEHLDALGLARLSACAQVFGKRDKSGLSLCERALSEEQAAWRTLRMDTGFRRTSRGKERMPRRDDWGKSFPGWVSVRNDWELALAHGSTGGTQIPLEAKAGRDSKDQRIEDAGAAAYMRMKFALGHFEGGDLLWKYAGI